MNVLWKAAAGGMHLLQAAASAESKDFYQTSEGHTAREEKRKVVGQLNKIIIKCAVQNNEIEKGEFTQCCQ